LTPDRSVEERLDDVEKAEAVCGERWRGLFRWKDNTEAKVSTLERNQYRFAGAMAVLGTIGAIIGGALVKMVLGG
jgi:hypothetical protein